MVDIAVAGHETARRPASGALDALVDAIEALAHARSVEDIAATVRTSARTLSGADGVAVVLRDGDRCHYLDEDAIGPLWKGSRFPIETCVSGWAMLNRRTAVIPDIYQDPRVPYDAYRPTFVKSMVMTPVGAGEPVAAIGAYWATERQPDDREVEVLSALARATATAFENVRLNASLTEALERRDFLIRELDHRVKNTLASVQAIAQQTAKTAVDKAAFVETFNARVMALSSAHALLTRSSWKSAELGDVVVQAVAPFPSFAGRIIANGPPVKLGPVQAVAAQLAVHELITNALKHGALSASGGSVAMNWSIDLGEAERKLVITWAERDGPPVKPPTRRGMGMRLIEDGLPQSLGGAAGVEYAPDGLRIRIVAPLSAHVQLA